MVPMNRDVTTEETTQSPEEQLAALQTEYKPRLIAALKNLGLDIDDDISDEDLEQTLNDEETFLSKLPASTDLESLLTNPAFAELQEVAQELIEKVMEITFGSLFG